MSAPCGADAVDLIRGAFLFKANAHRDARGELVAFEQGSNLEFALRRVYYINVGSSAVIRAEHACSAEQVIIALAGAVTVDMDNGIEKRSLSLFPGEKALCVRAGVWLRLRSFQTSTILLVAASRAFADTVYFDTPQPNLIEAI
jgi:dTDP-4-dehydrorhamnose 3,5-epimerase